MNTAPTWLQECATEAMELSQEKRQEFLDLIWSGKTLKESYEACGISFNAANGIMRENIELGLYLRRQSK